MQPLQALQAARGTLFPWVPVLIGCGVAVWFRLPWEPGLAVYLMAAGVVLALLGVWYQGPEVLQAPLALVACLLIGGLAAGLRVHLVAAPVLGFRYYGPIEGRVIEIDRSQSDDLRITLDRVVLDRVAPERTPRTVRVSLHEDPPGAGAAPGTTVILTGHLTAPPGASEPGGFDFRRMAYFNGLGAVGYTSTPVLRLAEVEPGTQWINRLRASLSGAITRQIPGQAGAFASGAVTGDRSGITQQTVSDLRDSNLSHLLAISGMNMAFITAFVFALVRYGMALCQPLALRVNSKKIAAVVSLAVAAFYLALSGANVATERAFLMVAVMLVAVLADRRALSLRSVALAATLLLVLRPESLFSPGFQMSFAATTALIAGFAALDREIVQGRIPRWAMPVFTLVLSSLLAGLATAPLAAAHFNRFTDYGLLANLMTVPAMGLLIMPGAVLAVLLLPLGLEVIGLWMLDLGSRWILSVARLVASWEGAVTGIPTPGPWVLPLLTLGALVGVLGAGRFRLWGGMPIAIALALWIGGSRPPILISADGALVAALGPQGRSVSSPTGAGFAARTWLENDGDLADQQTAAARPGFVGNAGERAFALGRWRGIHLKGVKAAGAFAQACKTADIVVSSVALGAREAPGCIVLDPTSLAKTGAVALWLQADGGLRMEPTLGAARLWSPPRR